LRRKQGARQPAQTRGRFLWAAGLVICLLCCSRQTVLAAPEPFDLHLPPLDASDQLPAFAEVAQSVEELSDIPPEPPPDATGPALLPIPPELAGPAPELAGDDELRAGPDYIEVRRQSSFDKGIVRVRGGGLTLYINSLVAGATITVTADSATFNTVTGEAELSGGVLVDVPAAGLRLACGYFHYDPLMQRMQVQAADVKIPVALLPADTLPPRPIRPQFTGHLYIPYPEFLYVSSDLIDVDYNPRRREFEMSSVKLALKDEPDPDFYVRAKTLSLGQDDHVSLTGIALWVSDLKVFEWPKYRRNPRSEANPVSFGFPSVRLDRHDGPAIRQPVTVNLGQYQIESVIDYADEYGVLVSAGIEQEVSPAFTVGLRTGTRNVVDLDRQRIERRDSLLGTLHYDRANPSAGLARVLLDAEYGHTTATTPRRPGQPAEVSVEADRWQVSGSLELAPVALGDDVYLTGGALGSYTDYGSLGTDYSVIGGEVGLVNPVPKDDFNNYIVYRLRHTRGTPAMGFDEVRRQELDFAAQCRPQRGWRQTLHGVYDIDGSRFDTLELGAMKRQRSYELGLYYDFARESTGLELGILVD
jgi:hypothetical protein